MKAVVNFADSPDRSLELPLPPSANRMFRVARTRRGRGRLVKSRDYKAWLALAGPLLRVGLERPALPARVSFVVWGGDGWSRNRDVDNLVKPLVDALVVARLLPDDNSRYLHEIRIRFIGVVPGRPAGVNVSFF